MGICSRASAGDPAHARASHETSALRDARGALHFWWLLEELQPASLKLVLPVLEKFLLNLHSLNWNWQVGGGARVRDAAGSQSQVPFSCT